MGTSKGYGGPGTGLVPSWIDDAGSATAPATSPVVPPASGAPGPPQPGRATPTQPTAPARPDTGGGGFGTAQGAFTRFARTGSRSSLGSALSRYVREGTGNGRRAARRMGASRSTGGRVLGLLRDVQNVGAAEALRRRLDLPGLAGQPAANVFLALLEYLCPPGGAVDEAIARQAMLDAIADLAAQGLGSFDNLAGPQLEEFFLDFVIHSIEGRVMADIGERSVAIPDDVAGVERAEQMLHDFVAGCTRGRLSGHLTSLGGLADPDIDRVMNEIYEAAFEIVAVAGEAAS